MDDPMAPQRAINTALKFWSACLTPRCRRHRRCSGDAGRCHAIFWPVVPHEAALWWDAAFEAHLDGHPRRRVVRAADAAAARYRALVAHSARQRRAEEARRKAEREAETEMNAAIETPPIAQPRLRSL